MSDEKNRPDDEKPQPATAEPDKPAVSKGKDNSDKPSESEGKDSSDKPSESAESKKTAPAESPKPAPAESQKSGSEEPKPAVPDASSKKAGGGTKADRDTKAGEDKDTKADPDDKPAEDEKTGEVDKGATAAKGARRLSGAMLARIGAGLASVLLIAAIVAAVFFYIRYDDKKNKLETENSAREAGCAYATTLATYDYKNIDKYVHDVLDGATGEFKDLFSKQGDDLKAVVAKAQIASKVTDMQCGVKSVSDDNKHAQVVVAIGKTATAAGQQETGQLPLTISFDKVNGRWLASKVDAPFLQQPAQNPQQSPANGNGAPPPANGNGAPPPAGGNAAQPPAPAPAPHP